MSNRVNIIYKNQNITQYILRYFLYLYYILKHNIHYNILSYLMKYGCYVSIKQTLCCYYSVKVHTVKPCIFIVFKPYCYMDLRSIVTSIT